MSNMLLVSVFRVPLYVMCCVLCSQASINLKQPLKIHFTVATVDQDLKEVHHSL